MADDSDTPSGAVSPIGAAASRLGGAAGRFLRRKELVLEDVLKLPLHIRHEIVVLARQDAEGEDIDPRWHIVQHALHNHRPNLAVAAEHLRKHEKKAGDTHLLDGTDRRTMEFFADFINGKATPDDILQRLVEDVVTDVRAVRLILGRDVSPNKVYNYGWTPLHVAAIKGNTPLAEALIEHGADVNAVCKAGYTPLHYACLGGNEETAVLLRRCDTDVTIKNRSGHTAFQCAASTGHRALAVKLDRQIGVRAEALLRAKRFYIQLIEGAEDYCSPYEEDKSVNFRRGRVLAAILLVKQGWLKGRRERRQLIPADLLDVPRLARKAFGKKWQLKVEMFDYRHPKLVPAIARIIFAGKINPVKLQSLLSEGQARYERMIAEREANRLEKLRRETVEDFITWLRHPSEEQRAAIMNVVYQETKRRWPITVTAIQDIMERETPLMIQEWDTMYKDDKMVMERLKQFWVENGKRVIGGDDDSDISNETPRDDSQYDEDSSTVASGTTATTKTKKPWHKRFINKLRRIEESDDEDDDGATATTAAVSRVESYYD